MIRHRPCPDPNPRCRSTLEQIDKLKSELLKNSRIPPHVKHEIPNGVVQENKTPQALSRRIGLPACNPETNFAPCGPPPAYLQPLSRWDLTIRLGLGHKLFVDSHGVLILSPSIRILILNVGALGSILATEQLYSRVVNIC
ncbi:hypothetical protein FJTKL_10185 [Diaporthe vaccinii]|uniref:Uncharacterized protein n=1 Tax=Diaporthe vaccinii TaxID=105482 RepID=A0ABR4EKW6_9PEZI